MCLFVTSTVFLFILFCFYLVGWEVGGLRYARACTFILDNTILHEKKISIPIVIADLEGFIQTSQSYLRTVNSTAGIAT